MLAGGCCISTPNGSTLSGGAKGAKRPLGRPLDRGVRCHALYLAPIRWKMPRPRPPGCIPKLDEGCIVIFGRVERQRRSEKLECIRSWPIESSRNATSEPMWETASPHPGMNRRCRGHPRRSVFCNPTLPRRTRTQHLWLIGEGARRWPGARCRPLPRHRSVLRSDWQPRHPWREQVERERSKVASCGT